MKILVWISAIMLFAALAPLPIGYYTLLRMIVTITAVLLAVNDYKNDKIELTIIFGIIALIFNPLIPIYLTDKSVWMPIDLIVGVLFIYQDLKMKDTEKFNPSSK